MTAFEALKEIKRLNTYCRDTGRYGILTDEKYHELYDIIEKELKQPQELYRRIKDKRDKLRLTLDLGRRKQDLSPEQKIEMLTEICTYGELLNLLEIIFDIDLLEVYSNECK